MEITCNSTINAASNEIEFVGETKSNIELSSSQLHNSFTFLFQDLLKHHDLKLVEVPGIGSCQLHSVVKSCFNEALIENENYCKSMTKMKWSLANAAETILKSFCDNNDK